MGRLSAVETAVFAGPEASSSHAAGGQIVAASGGREPIRIWFGLGSKAQQFPSRAQQTPPAPAAHTQKHTAMSRLGGGEINSFLFSLPLCQMTQIMCSAVTQCLAETKCMRVVYTLHRPRIYLFFRLPHGLTEP